MELLLDFSRDFDVALLDSVVEQFYEGQGPEQQRKEADRVLNQLRDHPDAWTKAGEILQKANSQHSKYLALAILDKLISTRWNTLPLDARQGIRNFVVTMCLEWSSDEAVFTRQRPLLNKANLTLVQILKRDWPNQWPQFIPDIVSSSRSGLEVCENNMAILGLLSEEVFDFSAEQLTSAKAKELKARLCQEFSEIYKLCHEVLEKASRPSLITATLRCLSKYLTWIPLTFIFETTLCQLLVTRFLEPVEFRNLTLQCLTEISELQAPQSQQYLAMFGSAVEQIEKILQPNTNLKQVYPQASSNDQDFIQNLALFFSAFVTSHLDVIEQQTDRTLLYKAHAYLIAISEIDEREIFKVCLDYWSRLVLGLYEEVKQIPVLPKTESLEGGQNVLGGAPDPQVLAAYPLRTHIYSEVLSRLRVVIIDHMVRPEEVLISENEDGEIVRVVYKESDTITLYKSLRDVLVYLTQLDVDDTEAIMKEKLERQLDDSEWSWHKLNTLCWAIGSISGTMNILTEKHFVVYIIKRLLRLTDKKRGKDNKAVVASNIMYIVGQYPRFLRAQAHWTFLKTVVNKLFEFMHETHEGVQDMACDTFMKITTKCKVQFVVTHPEDSIPFVEEIIMKIPEHTSDLAPHQIQQFYEACGNILSAQRNGEIQARLLEALMQMPNEAWTNLIQEFSKDLSLFLQADLVKVLINVIKTNTAVCTSLMDPFESQLCRIFSDMLALYKTVSEYIREQIEANSQFVHMHHCRLLRALKREILKLMEVFLSRTQNLEQVTGEIAPPLLAVTLEDYRLSPPNVRECEVLCCVRVIVEKVGERISQMVLGILENVFVSTLEMLSVSLTEYPEFRVEFFLLLRTINQHCFSTLLQLPNAVFAQTIDACLWATKHDNRDVEEAGLNLVLEILVNVIKLNQAEIVNPFFKQFTRLILGDIFGVLCDPDHRSGFILQSEILAVFVQVIETNRVTEPLYQSEEAAPGTPNSEYFKDYLSRSLRNAFPNLCDQQIVGFVQGMFVHYHNLQIFRQHLRDFLIQIKEFSAEDFPDSSAQVEPVPGALIPPNELGENV